MAGVLESLARGLRQAGGVISPDVQKTLASEDQADDAERRQIGMLQLQQRLQQEALQNSPEYKMKVDTMRKQKLYEEAVANSGGDFTKIAGAAMQYGKPEVAAGILDRQENRAFRLQQAKQSYDLKERELTQRAEDKAADRASRELAQQQLLELKRQGLALQGELAKSNQEIKRLQFTMKADQALQANVRNLGTALEKANLPQADTVLSDVEDALKKAPQVAEYISGPKSAIPDLLVPDNVKFARQAFQKLFNLTLKDRSGAAVTIPELERLKQEFATGVFKTDKQIQEAVVKARGIINKHYASVTAGFGPEALKAYNENMRGVGGKVVLEPPSSATPTDASDPLGIRGK